MGEEADRLRASDADRESVAQRLRAALDDGRLSLYEYDERLRDAYAAKTYGELNALLTDLPGVAPPARSQVAPAASPAPPPVAPTGGHTSRWIARMWSGWVTAACVLTVIWLLSGADGGYWPIWPLGVWGAVLLAQTINGVAGGAPHRMTRRDARRARGGPAGPDGG